MIFNICGEETDKLTLKLPCTVDGKFGILTVQTKGGEIISSNFSEGIVRANNEMAAD